MVLLFTGIKDKGDHIINFKLQPLFCTYAIEAAAKINFPALFRLRLSLCCTNANSADGKVGN